MARPLRLECAGALYHVTSRGDRRGECATVAGCGVAGGSVCQATDTARQAYRRFVMEGQGLPCPLDQARHQLLLGDEAFVAQYKHHPKALREVSKAQRRSVALVLTDYQEGSRTRKEAMARAYLSGAYTMAEIGDHFGVHYMTVSRVV